VRGVCCYCCAECLGVRALFHDAREERAVSKAGGLSIKGMHACATSTPTPGQK